MKRELLTTLSAFMLLCGCAGRMDSDLLQARIREQAAQLAESQHELETARSQLKQSRMEAARLKSQLDHDGESSGNDPSLGVVRLRIHSLSSGGLNKDNQPGDDVVVIHFAPIDSDSHPIQAAGQLELRLVDPLLPENQRELGVWKYSAEECQSHWTRGITSSGFQFTLPLNTPPRHANLMIQMKYRTADSRELHASQVVKVAVGPPSAVTTNMKHAVGNWQNEGNLDDTDESLPLIEDQGTSDIADRAEKESIEADSSEMPPGRAVLHSSNWTDATIPILR